MPHPDIERLISLYKPLHPKSCRLEAFLVDGEPKSKARPRFRRNGRVFASPEQKAAEEAMGWALKSEVKRMFEGNIAVVCIFYRPNRQRIDVDNLLKHVMDSATGICWEDDSQVTAQIGIVELDPEYPRTAILIGEHESSLDRSPPTIQYCEECGNEFTSFQERGRFCSRECANVSRGESLKRPVRCKWCNESFKRKTAAQKYCSEQCRVDAMVSRKKAKAKVSYCMDCGVKVSKPEYARCRSCWLAWHSSKSRSRD